MTEPTKPLSQRVEAIVRHIMRNLHPDGAEAVPEVAGVPEFLTPAEVDEVNAEVRRLYAIVDTVRDQIAARLPHLAEAQLAALDRELHGVVARGGETPGLQSGGGGASRRAAQCYSRPSVVAGR